MFILSREQFDNLKYFDIALKLGTTVKRLSFKNEVLLTVQEQNYGDDATKLLEFQTADGQTKMQVVDDRICPLIVRIETAEYILNLA